MIGFGKFEKKKIKRKKYKKKKKEKVKKDKAKNRFIILQKSRKFIFTFLDLVLS